MFYKKPVSILAGILLLAALASCARGASVPPQFYPEPPAGDLPFPADPIYPYPGPGESPDDIVSSPLYPGPLDPAPGEPAPWIPAPGDQLLERGNVYIDEKQVLVLESFPPQFRLIVRGSLPTPCHQLRVHIPEPDQAKRIHIEVYSLTKPGEMCIQVLEPFEVQIPLEGLPSGRFTVWVNGEQVSEIDNP
ncbi:MAG: hypothetical protein JXA78_15800 [Anaerolineales bacterium]|nr:hypothetical protein [Anaerolineales bacterium]